MTDRRLLLAAGFVRSIATGMIGPLLGFYLARLRLDDAAIGAVVSAGLAGAALATAWVMLAGHRLSRRTTLLAVAGLSLAGGAVAALASGPWVVGAAAFAGMLNGMGRDRGACLVVEQSMLPETAPDGARTRLYAWQSALQDAGIALGSLGAGLPELLRRGAGLGELTALRASLGAYLLLVAAAAVPYLLLSRALAGGPVRDPQPVSAGARRVVARISALFAIDSIAGGFLTSAFLALFFRRQFGASESVVALLFASRSVLNAASHLAAARLAARFGLVNTMVFTHVPSSLLLVTVTLAPDLPAAAALFLLREGLVEMDVPTRTSFVMAVVAPGERGFAAAATHLVRMSGWAVAPAVAGVLAGSAGSLAPALWVGAGLKLVYDALLWASFRRVRPPEER